MRTKDQIQIIMKDFNFSDVHKTMIALNRKWPIDNGSEKIMMVPALSDLKKVAEFCLNKVAESNEECITFCSGGFEAEKIENVLELRFLVDRVNPLSLLLNPGAKK